MKSIKSTLYVLSLVVFLSCSKDDGKIDFTLLQVNDVYEIAPIQNGKFGGMARVETVHQELLQENKNTMLVMGGDFLNPSLLGTIKYEGERISGKQMIEVMNAMNFGLVAFGNHEFDLKSSDLQKRLNESTFEWISGNVLENKAGVFSPFAKTINNQKKDVNNTFVKEFTDADGTTISVGFISVCIPSNPQDFVKYDDIFEEITRDYNEIKDKVDVVFGLTHVKIEQDTEILKKLPNIPLIMGGHEHTNMLIPVNKSVVAKADANAKTAYIHRISFDKKTKVATVNSELKEINESIVSDKRVGAIVDKWQAILKTKIKEIIENPDEVIYNAKVPLDGRDTPIRSTQTNLGEIIARSMSLVYDDKVDCALVNGGSIRIDDELAGDITAVDIFRVLPYGGAILKVKIKGSLLTKVLDFGISASGTGAYLQRYNAELKSDIWFVSGKQIQPNKVYTVAFSDYLLKGFDIPFLTKDNPEVLSVYNPEPTESASDIRKATIMYLKTLNAK
jgi:2',3'-cyclic-nucleotide 2'-phosphodiesterase (5'-nucleotidase family)